MYIVAHIDCAFFHFISENIQSKINDLSCFLFQTIRVLTPSLCIVHVIFIFQLRMKQQQVSPE